MKHDREDSKPLDLQPMERLNLSSLETTSELMRGLGKTAFTARCLGEAVDVAEQMIRDGSWVVLTLSGAMTMAGLSLVVVEMIERGWVNCLISTGALVGHGLTEDIGMRHFKADPSVPDAEYFKRRLNRVYDVIEPEENLDRLESEVRTLLAQLADSRDEPLGTHDLLAELGTRLPGRGVLQAAKKRGVPVFIPAFTDSELGLDFAVFNQLRAEQGKRGLTYDGFRDLRTYADLCRTRARENATLGIITIGGGVPRNWAQQVAPFIDISNQRLGKSDPVPRFSYGVRICPDPVHFGHLSGSTYSEGVSWGKFIPRSKGGRFSEVLMDATVAWPLIVRALIERGL